MSCLLGQYTVNYHKLTVNPNFNNFTINLFQKIIVCDNLFGSLVKFLEEIKMNILFILIIMSLNV